MEFCGAIVYHLLTGCRTLNSAVSKFLLAYAVQVQYI